MNKIKINGQDIEIDKKYYKNILVKLKNNNNIYSIGCIFNISKNLSRLNIVNRFYKIRSFVNEIPLDYVNLMLKNKLPIELVNKILFYFLKDDVSFRPIQNKKYSTFTIKYNVFYHNDLNKFQTTVGNIPYVSDEFNSKNIKHCSFISSIISDNILNLINTNNTFELNKIFYLTDENIEYCLNYYINSTKQGWGINFAKKN